VSGSVVERATAVKPMDGVGATTKVGSIAGVAGVSWGSELMIMGSYPTFASKQGWGGLRTALPIAS
jgi:hypothetical protein